MAANPPKRPALRQKAKSSKTYCEKTNEEFKLFQPDQISARGTVRARRARARVRRQRLLMFKIARSH